MSTKQVTVAVAGATLDALQATADFVAVVKKEVASGWNPATELPAIVMAAVKDFGKVVADVSEIKNEAAGDKGPVAAAVAIGGSAIVAAALS